MKATSEATNNQGAIHLHLFKTLVNVYIQVLQPAEKCFKLWILLLTANYLPDLEEKGPAGPLYICKEFEHLIDSLQPTAESLSYKNNIF